MSTIVPFTKRPVHMPAALAQTLLYVEFRVFIVIPSGKAEVILTYGPFDNNESALHIWVECFRGGVRTEVQKGTPINDLEVVGTHAINSKHPRCGELIETMSRTEEQRNYVARKNSLGFGRVREFIPPNANASANAAELYDRALDRLAYDVAIMRDARRPL